MKKPKGGKLGIKEERAATAGRTHPKKRLYRSRAHSNPLSDMRASDAPTTPADVDWAALYPAYFSSDEAAQGSSRARQPGEPTVRFVDVGCGFGGLLVRLSPLFPDTLILGMELRDKVALYVKERVLALRREHAGQYGNVACVRTNSQKYLPNFFRKGQLTKLFFLFPDPHFKVQNHRRRIISPQLLAEYAYLLAPGGRVYTATDVPELGTWMAARLDEHVLFRRLSEEEVAGDVAGGMLTSATEEGMKVARNEGQTFVAIYERIQPVEEAA
ncbi:hypothetical protein WJX81_008511 [Elliptochloris bilobata]|uniref:tRNA (guanine-N(7)-)-methyltransferase n=1 Tax=Elliptochloris bilobata TaxID=381761 RepID=A0AAW1SC32_9CHLO